ncbi:hypothetical protein [Psychrobacter sp. ENNN9_III]|uniref:hypothetical protein n=1 Tax=Psychrobacter sp. ENNN9_III TaxID=1254334 RepID=UPI00071E6BE5|nr:hypothetical protein [Psychrobacter sp. ENNN9_III]
MKNESGIEDFVINLQNTAIRYGCIQSLDLLEQRSYQTITDAMMHKFSAYLPSSLLLSDNKDKQI